VGVLQIIHEYQFEKKNVILPNFVTLFFGLFTGARGSQAQIENWKKDFANANCYLMHFYIIAIVSIVIIKLLFESKYEKLEN
jgi:hypothetical protein